MNRLDDYIAKLRTSDLVEDVNDDASIAAAITSGDEQLPEWASMSEDIDHIKIWDSEEGGSRFMGFVRINYSND